MDGALSHSLSEVSRREDRIFVTLPVTLKAEWESGKVVRGNTVDFSGRGLRVRANLPFRTKHNVEVMVIQEGYQPKSYNVKWVRDQGKDEPIFEAGLELQA
ncbi:MAG TPA: PilZ domain-containing protein [Terriglobia bacterium]|nr:PilZ domain-containing protein [Terriglobia bacterium]